MPELAAELIIENDLDSFIEDETEFSWNEYILEEELLARLAEYDKAPFKNIRSQTALLMELITNYDEYEYQPDRIHRQRHEVSGGYKIAKRRGARLKEVEVFNLMFRFTDLERRHAIGMMYPASRKGEKERILLMPENTRIRYEAESKAYLKEARSLVLKGRMDPDNQSELIENLRMLNIHERCAQTLQHEFGHVLHWREWQSQGIDSQLAVYNWFQQTGYYDIVDRRVPGFAHQHVVRKIHTMKESLVEDYRIALNIKAEHGKFILPNKYCFSGDFEKPELMYEGVGCMARVLSNQINSNLQRPASSSDYDSMRAFAVVSAARRKYPNWVAGERTATKDTIATDLEQLYGLEQVAVSIEMD